MVRAAGEDDIGKLVALYEHLVPVGRPFAKEDAKAIWRRFSYEGSAGFYRSIGFESTKTGFEIRRVPRRGS